MKVQQRDIIELNYELPNGKFKVHPALIISNSNVLEMPLRISLHIPRMKFGHSIWQMTKNKY